MPNKPMTKPNPVSQLGQMSRERALRDAGWVAEFLNVDPSWVERAAESGTLPSIQVGDVVRFDPEVIKAWVRGDASALSAPAKRNLSILPVPHVGAPGEMAAPWLPLLEQIGADVKALKASQKEKGPALLLSFRQAAKLLKVDRFTTLKVLVASGQLAVVKVNGRDRIKRSEVDRLASEGFDRDAPRKKRGNQSRKPSASAASDDVQSAIMKAKI